MNTLLQLTDAITGRRCAVRVDPEAAALPLSGLLDRYVRHFPARRLLEEGRVTVESSETLLGFQDLVYACSDSGALLDLYPGVELVQHGKPLALGRPPAEQAGRVGGVDVKVLDIGIDRTDAGYDRNWTGFHRRRWDRHADLYERFVRDALLACHSGVRVRGDTGSGIEHSQNGARRGPRPEGLEKRFRKLLAVRGR